MTEQMKKEIKEREPRSLNAYVYGLVRLENQTRNLNNRFNQGALDESKEHHIPYVDYYTALDACKQPDLVSDELIKEAQDAFNAVIDKAVGAQLWDIIQKLGL